MPNCRMTVTSETTPDETAALAARVAFLLDRLAEVCDGHETCEGCGEALCEACEVGEYGSQCNHGRILCRDCDAEGYCRDCAREDHEYEKADRLWSERGATEL